jgi:hypothetical protein
MFMRARQDSFHTLFRAGQTTWFGAGESTARGRRPSVRNESFEKIKDRTGPRFVELAIRRGGLPSRPHAGAGQREIVDREQVGET